MCVLDNVPSSPAPPAAPGFTEGLTLPPNPLHSARSWSLSLIPAAWNALGCGRRGWGPTQHPLPSLGFLQWTSETREPQPQTPHSVSQRLPPQPRRAAHRLGPGRLAPPSAPPSAPAGHGRSGPRAAAAARSLPASGQHPPPAPLSVSRRRPRRGLRLRHGRGWRCGSGSGSGRLCGAQQPGGFASAPRSRSASV